MFLSKILIDSCIIIPYIIEKNIFCRYCLQDFSTEEIIKGTIKDCFRVNGKQKFAIPNKGEYVKFKNYERKINSLLIIYADFESI